MKGKFLKNRVEYFNKIGEIDCPNRQKKVKFMLWIFTFSFALSTFNSESTISTSPSLFIPPNISVEKSLTMLSWIKTWLTLSPKAKCFRFLISVFSKLSFTFSVWSKTNEFESIRDKFPFLKEISVIGCWIWILLNTSLPMIEKEQFSKNNFSGRGCVWMFSFKYWNSFVGVDDVLKNSKFTLLEQVHLRIQNSSLIQFIGSLVGPSKIILEFWHWLDFTLRVKVDKNKSFNVVDILKITNLTSCTHINYWCKG